MTNPDMPKEYSSYKSSSGDDGDEITRQARRILRAFSASSSNIEACAAVTGDGFIIASVMADEVDEDRFGAMCASLLALSARAAAEIEGAAGGEVRNEGGEEGGGEQVEGLAGALGSDDAAGAVPRAPQLTGVGFGGASDRPA